MGLPHKLTFPMGIGYLFICLLISTSLVTADKLEWKSASSGPQNNYLYLFLWGGATSITALYRIYSTLYKERQELDKEDQETMPKNGSPIGHALLDWVRKLRDDKNAKISNLEEARELAQKTPSADYNLKAIERIRLNHLIVTILERFEELESLHAAHIDNIEEVTTKLRDSTATEENIDLEQLMQMTDESLKLAKHARSQFKQWFPADSDLTGDHIWQKLQNVIASWEKAEQEERERWTAAMKSCLPKNYHQTVFNPGQEPLIPTLWASGIQAALDAEADAAQKVRDQVTNLADQITQWEQATKKLSPQGNILDPQTAETLITGTLGQSDLTPIAQLLLPSARTSPLTPANLAADIRRELENVRTTIQNVCPKENFDDWTNLDRFLRNAQDWTKRSTAYWKRMSGVKFHPDGLDEDDSRALDSIMEQKYARTYSGTGYTPQQLVEIIEEMQQDLNTAGKRPTTSNTSCQHPEELAQAIHFNPLSSSWLDSIDEVTRLYDLSQTKTPRTTTTAVTDELDKGLFRASEAPEFKGRKEYWSYRSTLQRFVSGVIIKNEQRGLALNRILSRFTGTDVSDASNRWDLTPLIARYPTWESIFVAFLAELDRRFLSPEFATQQEIKFRSLRVKDKDPQEFILDFETQVRTTQEALRLAGMNELENGEIMRQLLAVLPGDIRAKIKDQYRRPESEDFFTITPDIIRWWINLDVAKPRDKRQSTQKTSSKSATTKGNNGPGTPRTHPAWGTCNKPCWDTDQTIPNGRRGKYMNIERGRELICPHCRRTEKDHGGNSSGCQHHGEHRWHTNNSSSGQPSGNELGDQ